MKHLFASDYQEMRWKNGGGLTREILVWPGADWSLRLSMATVGSDGPFSVFEGVDRTLTVLTGEGVDLTVAGQQTRLLPDLPFAFPGDAETSSRLIGGTVTDFNVMTRRARLTHHVEVVSDRVLSHDGLAAVFVLDPWPGVGRHDLLLPEGGEDISVPGRALWVTCADV